MIRIQVLGFSLSATYIAGGTLFRVGSSVEGFLFGCSNGLDISFSEDVIRKVDTVTISMVFFQG